MHFLYFQLKPESTSSMPATASGLASTSSMNPSSPVLIPKCSNGSVGSAVPEDGEEQGLAVSVDQITPASTKRSRKETQDAEEI